MLMLLCVCAQFASVAALAALVNKDKLTLFDLVWSGLSEIVLLQDLAKEGSSLCILLVMLFQVSKMDMYLTTTDHIVRSRGFFFPLFALFSSTF
jgi:uncharacterized membrane protein YobD (UPF0266 family)